MQSNTGIVSSSSSNHVWFELFARVTRYLRGAAMAELPATRWPEMKPVGFDGEDTSLTQQHLELLR